MPETLHLSSLDDLEHTQHHRIDDSKLLEGTVRLQGQYHPRLRSTEEFEQISAIAHERAPELWEWLMYSRTDGLHGTQSGSLRSICEHGILPQKELGKLPHPVTSVEFHSLPEPRPSVHMVHWIYAQEIAKYGEDAAYVITPDNYKEAIYPEETVESWQNSHLLHFTHLRNRHLTAVALQDYLQSPSADREHISMLMRMYPVVFGIRSEALTQDKLSPMQSAIWGDVAYEGIVEPTALTCLFVPQKDIEYTRTLTDKPVFALEDLRAMTNDLA